MVHAEFERIKEDPVRNNALWRELEQQPRLCVFSTAAGGGDWAGTGRGGAVGTAGAGGSCIWCGRRCHVRRPRRTGGQPPDSACIEGRFGREAGKRPRLASGEDVVKTRQHCGSRLGDEAQANGNTTPQGWPREMPEIIVPEIVVAARIGFAILRLPFAPRRGRGT